MNKQPEVTAATRKKIIDAFWSLYKQKNIEKITVGEITKITNNNRSTFYHYFNDVYAVLEEIETNLINEIQSEINNVLTNQTKSIDINNLYAFTIPIFKKHEEKIFTLIGKNGDPNFTNEFRKNIRSMLMKFWNLSDEMEHLDYLIEYSFSAMMGLMSKWYENGNDLTDTEFFKMAQGLIAKGVVGYLEN